MSNYDNGFARAQREYERKMPPEDNRIECPTCEGSGRLNMSDCCEAEIVSEVMCSKCGEICEPAKCTTCEGDGVVEPPRKEEREPEREE